MQKKHKKTQENTKKHKKTQKTFFLLKKLKNLIGLLMVFSYKQV